MSQADRDQLQDILEQKKVWLIKMRDITRQCADMLEKDDIDAFSGSLEAREGIISKIDAFSKKEKQISAADDAQILVLKQDIRGIIQEIIQIDEQITAQANSRIEFYKDELKNLNQKKKGIGKYINAYQKTDAYYFDEKK